MVDDENGDVVVLGNGFEWRHDRVILVIHVAVIVAWWTHFCQRVDDHEPRLFVLIQPILDIGKPTHVQRVPGTNSRKVLRRHSTLQKLASAVSHTTHTIFQAEVQHIALCDAQFAECKPIF